MVLFLLVNTVERFSTELLPSSVRGFLFVFTLGCLWVAIGIAILRYRLYDIDILINRTLVYGSLTAMLLAVYFGGVATIQVLLGVLTGQEEQP